MTAAITDRDRRKWRGPKFALALPSIIWYSLFFVIPIAFIIVYSFGTKDTTKLLPVDLGKLTTGNYSEVFDDTFFKTFKATLRISVIATLMCLLIGLPVAYFAAFKVSEKWRAAILALVVIPSFTSFLIRTVAWRIPLAPKGEFSRWLIDIGLIGDRGIQLLETQTAVQIAIVYNYLGFMILPLFVAFDRIDVRMREASKDLGAGRITTFFSITLPLAGPGIAAGVLLTFIPMCGDYVTATVLGGAKGNMIGSMIASQFSQAQNWPLGSAMAVLMIGAVLLALVVGVAVVWVVPRLFGLLAPISEQFRRSMHARRTARAIAGATRRSMSVDLNRLLLAVWAGLVLLFLFIPIALVFRHSFNGGSSFSIWSGETSTKWWGELFDGGATWAVLLRFVVITALALILKKIFARTTDIASRRLNWVGPGGFVVALVVNG
ncbi:MAG: ABC transporter permease subunit, partial [Ilumatobacteraceae bacterium]